VKRGLGKSVAYVPPLRGHSLAGLLMGKRDYQSGEGKDCMKRERRKEGASSDERKARAKDPPRKSLACYRFRNVEESGQVKTEMGKDDAVFRKGDRHPGKGRWRKDEDSYIGLLTDLIKIPREATYPDLRNGDLQN